MGGSHYPVLLLPGWSDRPHILEPLRGHLEQAGWAAGAVRVLGFRDRYGSNVEHAAELGAAGTALCAATQQAAVDVVAHSMGGLALRHALLSPHVAAMVRRVVFLATPHRGTWLACFGWGAGAREMRPGSAFLRELSRHPLPPHIRALTIRTPLELRVWPHAHARLENVPDLVVRYPTHPGLMRHPRVWRAVREFLSGG